ncbi:MAG TPA: heparan-alpha-glucosaminide N-acetyltransferase domain-containing protein [Flavisolibacter sp.]|nr:heparan-alpha-glucosaminide N-acetyltransferase domain-containing protein [Flavisolibacter sp.]
MKRIASIDIVRGLVMIIMALDHTRDLIHVSSVTQSPTDLATTTVPLFFTRWITHLCAPTFVFLSGSSAYISSRNKTISEARKFLLTRGLWLVLLEFTLVNFGVWFDVHFNVFLFDVIATIGCGFIVTSLLLNASSRTFAVLGLAIIFLHNLAPLMPFAETSLIKRILMPLFAPGAFPFDGGRTFVMGYPPIPWLGIMLTGFAAGKIFELPVERRRAIFWKTGLASLVLFVVIRAVNVYGDSVPWSTQNNGAFTFLSFMNVTKYPPSLVFCLVTLGIMFLLFYLVEGKRNQLSEIATVYGKVPLFYFLVHWYIIHPIMFLIVFMQGYKSSDLVFGFSFGRPQGPSGLPLRGIYLLWIVVVALLYPLCKWYGKYKEAHREKKWLRYL